MPYTTIDVDVDFWDVWDGLWPSAQEEILEALTEKGRVDPAELSDLLYEVEYLHLHDDKSTVEVLKELERRLNQ